VGAAVAKLILKSIAKNEVPMRYELTEEQTATVEYIKEQISESGVFYGGRLYRCPGIKRKFFDLLGNYYLHLAIAGGVCIKISRSGAREFANLPLDRMDAFEKLCKVD
jgi:hypothetical protein